MAKSMALMALGAGGVLAYQKYSKPLMKKMDKDFDKVVKKVENKLDNME